MTDYNEKNNKSLHPKLCIYFARGIAIGRQLRHGSGPGNASTHAYEHLHCAAYGNDRANTYEHLHRAASSPHGNTRANTHEHPHYVSHGNTYTPGHDDTSLLAPGF